MNNNFNIRTFNAGNAAVNLGGTIHGDQIEVAKHYLEESVWAKASLTYLDKLSEEPNHGD
jgi:hypothetical protein